MPETDFLQIQPAGPVHRAIAVALLVASLALLFFGVWQPLAGYFTGQSATLASGRASLARYEAIAARSGEVSAQIGKSRAAAGVSGFLAGKNEASISAELQGRLKSVFEEGVAMRSTRALPPRMVGGIKYLGVRVEVGGPWHAVQAALYRIETQVPFLFVTSLVLRAPSGPDSAGLAGEPLIEAQFEVFGALEGEVPP